MNYKDIPSPIVNKKEERQLVDLTARYEKMIQPNVLVKTGKAVVGAAGKVVPKPIKNAGAGVKEAVAKQEILNKALQIIMNGFSVVQGQAAKITLSEAAIIKAVNKTSKKIKAENIEELCLMRSYDISRAVDASKGRNKFLAFTEGGTTGFFGFSGIPFNLVLSTFICFRAVQNIAMFYGYDVKHDDAELVIAGEVFMSAMSPFSQKTDGISGSIGKVMLLTEVTAIKQTAKKTWTDMAARGGISLVLAQMRALANASARKALENAGKQGLEKSLFKEIFEQIGKKLTMKNIGTGIPVAGALVGAGFDTAQMNTVIQYADIFYQKRFILEKEVRINLLMEQE